MALFGRHQRGNSCQYLSRADTNSGTEVGRPGYSSVFGLIVASYLERSHISSLSTFIGANRSLLLAGYDRSLVFVGRKYQDMSAGPNEITSLDASMTLLFHLVAHSRRASEFNCWAA